MPASGAIELERPMAATNRSSASRPKTRANVAPGAKAQPAGARASVASARPGGKERGDLSDQARTRLEEMIVSLELAPGSIWSEAELSARIGIGRTPVREALQRLEADHLVRILPRHGAQITEINVVEQL